MSATPGAWCALALLAVVGSACTSTGREPTSAGPAVSVASAEPAATAHTGERFESQSSASTPEGAAWEFVEGLSVRITGVTLLATGLGARTRGDIRLTLVRIDFSYTNNGPLVNLSEGRQMPVRLLYGDGREEAVEDGGHVGTSDQLTLRVPTSVPTGATVHGASSFIVPVAATDALAVLVVEPRRYTEHLFTDVERLLPRVG